MAGADLDAVRHPVLLDVATRDRLDGGQVQDFGPQGGAGLGESNRRSTRPAAHVQHAADVVRVEQRRDRCATLPNQRSTCMMS